MGVCTSFVQEEQQYLQSIAMTSATDVLEDVSIRPDIQILEFEVVSEHPPSISGCTLILRQLPVRHNRAVDQ